jgi:hypothetical protein
LIEFTHGDETGEQEERRRKRKRNSRIWMKIWRRYGEDVNNDGLCGDDPTYVNIVGRRICTK